MSFVLCALLSDKSPKISIESLFFELKEFFKNDNEFSLEFEKIPFKKNKNVLLKWGGWKTRVHYEEGIFVQSDSSEIQKNAGSDIAYDVSKIDKRVRVVFGSDDKKEYTNQIIHIISFLEDIEGVFLFDPQKNNFLKQ